MRRRIPCFALLAVLAVVVGVFLFSADSLPAGVAGSPHDFSSSGPYTQSTAIAPSGTCSACHIPHGADSYALWARDLGSYRTRLIMDASTPTEPNYVLSPTIQCYDCHDYHGGGSGIDDLPPTSTFNNSHKPQNIAFGFTKNGTGSMTEDAPAGSVSGYYENKPPYASAPSSNLGADPGLNPSDNVSLLKTGGHYFKTKDPTGTSSDGFDLGDKLPCRDCHSPHEYSTNWQAFIRKDLPISNAVGSLTNVYASSFMANSFTSGSRSDSESRKICAACHAYSNLGTPVRFSEINPQYTAGSPNTIVQPPGTIAEHLSSSTVACVSCHNHNAIDASCTDCHGFPPPHYPPGKNPDNVAPYTVTPEVTHAVHFGKQNGSGAVFSKYSFQCNICHANSAMGTKTPSNHGSDNVDVDFDFSTLAATRAWIDNTPTGHPAHFQPFTGSAYTRTTCGPTGRGGVYCHSDGHDNTAVSGYYKNVTWGTASLVCSGCHGNPSYGAADIRYGMPDKSDHPNSHERHVVGNGYECSVCHFNTATGTYLDGSRAIKGTTNAFHVNGTMDLSFNPAAATGSYTLATKTCSVSCHGTDAPVWGTTLSGGCLGCHSGTEQVYKPQNDYGTLGTPNPVDNNEYLWSGHGSGSNYTGSNNLPAGFSNYTTAPVACYVCHSQAASHTTKSANDPFRLGSATDGTLGGFGGTGGFTGAWTDNTDALCLGCHGDTTQRSGHDNAAQGTTTIDAQTHARGITGVKYNWPVTPWKCVDCHDPHGDGKSGADRYMMIRSGINAPIDNADSNAGSDVKSRPKRTGANVLAVAFDSLAGYAAGSYAQSGNGPTTWGPCEVCHTQTTAYSRTADNLGSHASRTNRCTTCHPHKAGFAPTACKGCHGPDGVATAAAAPNVGTYWTNSGHGMTTPKTINLECEACHDTSFVTSADHKTDGTAGAGPPPANINTQMWPGKTENVNNQRNQNTAHLGSAFFPAGFPGANPANKYLYPLAFDQKCGNPAAGCHSAQPHYDSTTAPNGAHPQRPAAPVAADNVLTFGQSMTTGTPKAYYWYPSITDYATQFYQSRSPWDIEDITTRATGMAVPDSGVRYGVCVSCHDPHGTNAPANRPGHTTNVMLRGDTLNQSQFCNTACHTTRTPP